MTPEETKLFIGYLGSFMVDAHKAEQELSPERLLMISLIQQTLDGYQHALDQEEAQQDPSPSSQNPHWLNFADFMLLGFVIINMKLT